MKTNVLATVTVTLALVLLVAGCDHAPGKPGFRPETLRPDQTVDFAVLYKSNCSACHGENGLNGAAFPLNNPVYLAWAGHDAMLPIVANGGPQGPIHAFATSSGGFLTNQQIGNIVDGMIAQWGKPDILNGANPPSYSGSAAGDAVAGKTAFAIHCARCHGADGAGSKQAVVGSIVDPTYLSLVSNQGLRDIVVAGLPGEGMPDWRGDSAGDSTSNTAAPNQPMTEKEVTDIVAWLASHRVQFPGQPFPTAQPAATNAALK